MRGRINDKSLFLLTFIVGSASISGGCTQSAITPEATEVGMPAGWVRGGDAGTVDLNWLEGFDDPQLTALVSEAIASNYLLDRAVLQVAYERYPGCDHRRINRKSAKIGTAVFASNAKQSIFCASIGLLRRCAPRKDG